MLSKILVVHESPVINKIISTYVMSEFPNAAMVKTQKSLEGFKQLKVEPYDVIISGIEMAFPDGFELNRLKRETSLNAETPIVMITSNLSDNQKIRMVREGIDHFLFAPFSSRQLAKVVEDATMLRTRGRHERYGMPGAEATLELGGRTFPIIVINISPRGMLIEMDYQDRLAIPWTPVSLTLTFPDMFRLDKAEAVFGVLDRQEAVERGDDQRPKIWRLAWVFLKMPPNSAKVLQAMLENITKDSSHRIEQRQQSDEH